ncbi:hypothetical protein MO867_01055 [Microbulbifer sp. OS29]|uniref:Winged helix-turn helix n=1 Tax=Microbulbifer okhotskensis TaxID=2926617 RepID=A0A9X2EKW9_9GAMM|nr:hypothetical protein [Microbulbifer okhotskensis]MCO1332915.1 hypothetical protein [Microbulbifer okhotskensis]
MTQPFCRKASGRDREGFSQGANHGGKNSEEQAKLRSKIIKMTTKSKPKDGTHWTTRGMAKALGVNHSFVSSAWQEVGLKPHLTTQLKVSNDPDFEEKLRDIIGHRQKILLSFVWMKKSRFRR